MANTPGYQSQWGTQINDIMDKIQKREKFTYDVNGDALYNQYKDRFMQQGRLAMQDTMAQAAALTGGYGNSYAQNVGQQAYQGYMQGLNDKIPQLYQLAMDKYNREGDAMMDQYGLLTDRDNADYGRWQNAAALAQSQINAMLAKGQRPSEALIQQSGMSPEYIEAMLYVPPAPSYSGGGDDGGSSGGSKSSGGRGGNSGKNGGVTVDMGSVLGLGRGPISGSNLGNLVNSGQVTQKQNGNKITFENNKKLASKPPVFGSIFKKK